MSRSASMQGSNHIAVRATNPLFQKLNGMGNPVGNALQAGEAGVRRAGSFIGGALNRKPATVRKNSLLG